MKDKKIFIGITGEIGSGKKFSKLSFRKAF